MTRPIDPPAKNDKTAARSAASKSSPKRTPKPTSSPKSSQRRARGLLSVGVELDKILQPHHRKRGIADADLVGAWSQIMGKDLAHQCSPQRLARGPQGEPGTLHLNVWGPLALELQHLSPQLIERVNSHYGYRAVGRLAFHQLPAPANPPGGRGQPSAAETGRPYKTGPSRHEAQAASPDLEARLTEITDPELRAALLELGRSIETTESKS